MEEFDLNKIVYYIDKICNHENKNSDVMDLGKRGFLNSEHPHVEIEYNGEIICIDTLIYPFMKLIWSKGIETTACCQGDDVTEAYISFSSLEHILKFCNEFTYFKVYGEFDILNINLAIQGHHQLVELTYDIIASHTPIYGDLYSVRFKTVMLCMFE